jgi:cold shock protein
MEGTVQGFSSPKGSGSVVKKDRPGVFVHFSAIVGDARRTLHTAERITLEIQRPKGPHGTNVVKPESTLPRRLTRVIGSLPVIANAVQRLIVKHPASGEAVRSP